MFAQPPAATPSAAVPPAPAAPADVAAARYTRDPLSLAEALRIITRHPGGGGYFPDHLAPLCIRASGETDQRVLALRRNTNPPLGLGWRVDADAKGRARWHHAGSQEGGRAGLVVYPELRLSIAFASNVMTVPGDVLRPSADLADAFA